MKKTISLLLVAVLLVACMTTTVFAAHAGDTNVNVTIYASGEGFANFSCGLSIPSVVESVNDGFSFSNGSGDFFKNRIAFATGGAILSGEVAVLNISVNLFSDAAPGTYTFTGTGISAYDNNGQPTTISVYGSVTITCDHVAGTPVEEAHTSATCTTDGCVDTVTYCSKCDTEMDRVHTTVPATGHNYTAVVTAPTCTEKGYTTYTCTCGDSYTSDEVAALGHSYDNGVVTTAPTCTTAGVKTYTCTTCEHSYTEEVAATGHSYTSEVTTPATCTTDGVRTYTCSTCGDTYTEVIPATGHNYTWVDNEDGKTHTGTCACGHTVVEDHTYGPNGSTCDKCGYKKPADNTTPTKPGAGGDMGDTTPYPVFVLMAVAAVMGTAYGFKRKFEI